MRQRPDVHPPPLNVSQLCGLIARHRAGELSRWEQFELDALVEDWCARRGVAIVSEATAQIVDRASAGADVSSQEIEAAMYCVWSGALSEYWQPDEPELEELEPEPA